MNDDSKFWLGVMGLCCVTVLGCCGLTVQCEMHRADTGHPPRELGPSKWEPKHSEATPQEGGGDHGE